MKNIFLISVLSGLTFVALSLLGHSGLVSLLTIFVIAIVVGVMTYK